ncbi:MAG TPA: WXG100 family type VII secretion target [Aggregatilineales bacterium]|nr:WXG100 family type VII secretion target [Anaerolineales bacterium]HRE46999.1 WXG100 family type VII secretion target [Aggregatilineales bacterium]
MTAQIIQSRYDELAKIVKTFQQHANEVSNLTKTVQSCVDALAAGGWVGEGATRFVNEMREIIFPGFYRLDNVLQEASGATGKIIQVFHEAEDDAGRLFGGQGGANGTGSGANGSGGPSGGTNPNAPAPPTRKPGEVTSAFPPVTNGAVPLYLLDMDNPNFDAQKFIRELNTGGRPVIFMAHGYNVSDAEAKAGYINAADWYSKQYGHLPPEQRPVIVGVDWASSSIKFAKDAGYAEANTSAISTGQRFGQLLEQYNTFHPESSVNVVAHSLGNRMFMEGVATANVKVDNYLAVQAAVNNDFFEPGGRYNSSLGTEIKRMGQTYTPNDQALNVHEFFGYGDATGHSKLNAGHFPVQSYNMQGTDSVKVINLPFGKTITIPTGTNHYNYDAPEIRPIVVDFFGRNFDRR